MKKKLLIIGGIFILILSYFFIGNNGKEATNENVIYQNTISISRSYVALRIKTDKVLRNGSKYESYDKWNNEVGKLVKNWKNLEKKSYILEEQADYLYNRKKTSYLFVDKTYAYTKSEISNIFDNAPAGKKIKTLAKYLGVDAKRAYKILKSDQEFVKADAWNDAGDTFKKLEASAIALKDGCKVAGYIGSVAITGGAAGAIGSAGVGSALLGGSAGIVEGTTMIVTGVDLMLEVTEDGATIALGDNHKAVKAIGDMRSYTDPAASILSLTDIPGNVAKGAKLLDKVGVVLVEIDQIRSVLQDGKLLGINITPDSKIEVAKLKENEEQKWIDDNISVKTSNIKDFNNWIEGFETLSDWMDDGKAEENSLEENNVKKELNEGEENLKKGGSEKKILNNKKEESNENGRSVKLISPTGDSVNTNQAHSWSVSVSKGKGDGDVFYQCYWSFYVDGVEKWSNLKGCSYVSSIPWESGNLKIKVKVEFTKIHYEVIDGDYAPGEEVETKRVVDIIDTIFLEKEYNIIPVPKDTHVYGK